MSPALKKQKAELESRRGSLVNPQAPQGAAHLPAEPGAAPGLGPLTPAPLPSTEPSKSSIMPFRALKRPLQFLGLFETSLCRLTHIPAYKVGVGREEQGALGEGRGGLGAPQCLTWARGGAKIWGSPMWPLPGGLSVFLPR